MEAVKNLNEAQNRAALHVSGPMLVLAGAGSGKTRVVTYRIAHLIEVGIPYHEIVAVTFTNKAAREMQERVHRLVDAAPITTTFHSLGLLILREFIEPLGYGKNFTVRDQHDSEALLKKAVEEGGLKYDANSLNELKQFIHDRKNKLIFFRPEPASPQDQRWAALADRYQAALKETNSVDFDDLLLLPNLLLENPSVLKALHERWRYFLIDEYQDTNHAQYNMVITLAGPHKNVFAVGDPDQSIYSWRGANIENILRFEEDFPGAEVVSLSVNYRSTAEILHRSNKLINNNPRRYEKQLTSHAGEGDPVMVKAFDKDREEASFIASETAKLLRTYPNEPVAVLYRTNFQSRLIEDALLSLGIPYTIYGGISFYLRREIKDILAYLRFSLYPLDTISFERALSAPKRGIGSKTLEKLHALAKERRMNLHELLQNIRSTDLSQTQMAKLEQFYAVIREVHIEYSERVPIYDTIHHVITSSGYLAFLKEDRETEGERSENIGELASKAFEWQSAHPDLGLESFLEEVALAGATDRTEKTSVFLMTLHHAKGLEFPTCFISALEEDILPHAYGKESQEAVEEERRLLYVGMTRAMRRLYLLHSRFRFLWGQPRPMMKSRFLSEIFPRDNIPASHFLAGERVLHPTFGPGKVVSTFPTSSGDAVRVAFQDGIERTLITQYAKLTKGCT